MLIGLLGTILLGLATWTLVTLIELQLMVTMINKTYSVLTNNSVEFTVSLILLEVNNEPQ